MMNKKNLPHIITVAAFVVFIVLGLACASTPTVPVELSEQYRKYLLPPAGNERAIDTVGVRGSTSFVCKDGQHAILPAQVLGATYQVRDPNAPNQGNNLLGSLLNQSEQEDSGTQGHRHEAIFPQLLNEAKRQYPSETVDIRNARTSKHIPTNARQEEYQENVKNSNGTYSTVTKMRMVWDCFPYYEASVITTEPMPAPVTHSENFTKPGATRADINRLALNWLEDNKQSRRISIDSQDFDRGRIRGTVTVAARADQTYRITSAYTIDIFDARVEIRFDEPALQRATDTSLQNFGNPEQIFLQSIADAALAEIVDFSTTLRSYILSR